MNANSCRRVRSIAGLFGFAFVVIFMSNAQAQFVPVGPAWTVELYSAIASRGTSHSSSHGRGRGKTRRDGSHGCMHRNAADHNGEHEYRSEGGGPRAPRMSASFAIRPSGNRPMR